MRLTFAQSEQVGMACQLLIAATRSANKCVNSEHKASWNVKTNVNEDDVDKTTFDISCRLTDGRESSTISADLVDLLTSNSASLVDKLVDLYTEAINRPKLDDIDARIQQSSAYNYTSLETKLFVIVAELVGENLDVVGRFTVQKRRDMSHCWEVYFYSHIGYAISRFIDMDIVSEYMIHYAISDMVADLRRHVEAQQRLRQARWTGGLPQVVMIDEGGIPNGTTGNCGNE